MTQKYSARDLAFQYLARLQEDLNEELYLKKLIEVEAKFTALLTTAKPPAKRNTSELVKRLAR